MADMLRRKVAASLSGSARDGLSLGHRLEALLQPLKPRLLPAQRVRDFMQVPFGLRIGGLDQAPFESIDLVAQLPRLSLPQSPDPARPTHGPTIKAGPMLAYKG